MDDYIRREDAINAVLGLTMYKGLVPVDSVLFNINEVKSADVREVVRGRWMKNYNAVNPYDVYACSICQKKLYFPFRYCPNCGAKMGVTE